MPRTAFSLNGRCLRDVRRASLAGYICPECRGLLRLRTADAVNVCRGCGLELVTEWVWEQRQNQTSPNPRPFTIADDLPGSY